MDTVFLEVYEQLEPYTDSVWIPASKILSFVVNTRPDTGGARLCIEAERIRNVNQHPVTPWLNSVEEAEAARNHLIPLLNICPGTFEVVRWRDTGFAGTSY